MFFKSILVSRDSLSLLESTLDESSIVNKGLEFSGQHHTMQGGSLKITKVVQQELSDGSTPANSPKDVSPSGGAPPGNSRGGSLKSSKEKLVSVSKEKSINIASKDRSAAKASVRGKAPVNEKSTHKGSITREKAINKEASVSQEKSINKVPSAAAGKGMVWFYRVLFRIFLILCFMV